MFQNSLSVWFKKKSFILYIFRQCRVSRCFAINKFPSRNTTDPPLVGSPLPNTFFPSTRLKSKSKSKGASCQQLVGSAYLRSQIVQKMRHWQVTREELVCVHNWNLFLKKGFYENSYKPSKSFQMESRIGKIEPEWGWKGSVTIPAEIGKIEWII